MADRLFLVGAFASGEAGEAAAAGPGGRRAFPLPEAEPDSGIGEVRLLCGDSGSWRLEGADPDRQPAPAPADGEGEVERDGEREIARLLVLPPGGESDVWQAPPIAIVPADCGLLVNGIQPLGLRLLKPGDLVSAGETDWVLLRRHDPSIGTAPPGIASSPCPVCAMPLDEAPVCRCSCGTWYHLEDPAGDPDSKDQLNCFLSAPPCTGCRKPKRLEETWIPSPQDLHL